ncbi:hypothetical protein ABKN59_008925 [Abortiporus biennis]
MFTSVAVKGVVAQAFARNARKSVLWIPIHIRHSTNGFTGFRVIQSSPILCSQQRKISDTPRESFNVDNMESRLDIDTSWFQGLSAEGRKQWKAYVGIDTPLCVSIKFKFFQLLSVWQFKSTNDNSKPALLQLRRQKRHLLQQSVGIGTVFYGIPSFVLATSVPNSRSFYVPSLTFLTDL